MKKLTVLLSLLCLTLALSVPARALEYTIEAPEGPDYGMPTSIEPVITADRGEAPNVDKSKNAARIPPAFGSPSAYALNTGLPLTPNLAPGYMAGGGTTIPGGTATAPPPAPGGTAVSGPGFTEVTADRFYQGGYLAVLSIPGLGVEAKVYQGTDSQTLAKGIGHFAETSLWEGNVCLAAHNRGISSYFGEIHTLNVGDTITLTTKLGARNYSVVSVETVSETDRSGLGGSGENCLTLYTCVRDQRDLRWCVRAVEM